MRILITGINGFVGSSLASAELDRENFVVGLIREYNHKSRHDILDRCVVIRGDLNDFELLKRIIADYEIDLIYHVAAQPIVRIADRNPLDCYWSNVMGTVSVMEAVRVTNPKIKVVYASSDKAYGAHDVLPYQEKYALKASDPYGTSKACGDMVAQSFAFTYDMNINIIRCANIFGFDMNSSRIIPNTINRILSGKKPQIYSGVLHYKREFIHIDDVCSAYQIVAEKGEPGEAYNIGDEEWFTIEEIVNRIARLMDYEGDIDIVGKDFGEIPFQYLSAEKLKGLGWEKKVSLTEGLRRTIELYSA